jgi:ABC-type multidrug transport system fused ATPase/permease subunit
LNPQKMSSLRKIQIVLGKECSFRFLGVFALLLLVAILEALGVGAVFPLLVTISSPDQVENSSVGKFLLGFWGLSSSLELLPYLCVLILILYFAKNIILFFANYLQAKIIHDSRASLSERMFENYLRLDYDLFTQKKVSEMIHSCCGVVNQFVIVYCPSLLKIIADVFIIIAIFLLLILINPKISIGLLAFSLLFGLFYTRLTKTYLERVGGDGQDATVGFYKVIFEALSGAKEIKARESEDFFMNLFKIQTKKYRASMVRVTTMQVVPKIAIESLIILMVVLFILFAYFNKQDISLLLPYLGVFGFAFLRLYPSFHSMLSSASMVNSHQVTLEVLYEEARSFFVAESSNARSDNVRIRDLKSVLELKNVSYKYPTGKENALSDVSLKIFRGESIAFIGKSGSGKTTLVDTLLGLLRPKEGKILLDGANVFQDLSGWRSMIGYIPQHIVLTNDTIQQNIAFGVRPEDIDHKALRNSIKSAQLQEFIDDLPEGGMTEVGDCGVRLSGGQRQRIGIARALYRNPEILIFDEATSALDNETEVEVSKAIDAISKEKTVIIITHRMSSLRNCNRLYLLDAGQIVAQGTYNELMNKNQWFRKVNDLASLGT